MEAPLYLNERDKLALVRSSEAAFGGMPERYFSALGWTEMVL